MRLLRALQEDEEGHHGRQGGDETLKIVGHIGDLQSVRGQP